LTYDALKFHSYLETIIASNSTTASGGVRQHQSQWLFTDAANTIFQIAKRRCYTISSPAKQVPPPVIDLVDIDDDEWAALDEAGNEVGVKEVDEATERRPVWLPEGMDPVLEELPKWTLLADVLQEIEEEIMRQESLGTSRLAGTCKFRLSSVELVLPCWPHSSESRLEYNPHHDLVYICLQTYWRILVSNGSRRSSRHTRPKNDAS
jgi:hypothetical protein